MSRQCHEESEVVVTFEYANGGAYSFMTTLDEYGDTFGDAVRKHGMPIRVAVTTHFSITDADA